MTRVRIPSRRVQCLSSTTFCRDFSLRSLFAAANRRVPTTSFAMAATTTFEPRVQAKMETLLLACQQGIVAGWDATVDFMLAENMAIKTRIRPDMVGIHSRNRGRYGIDIVGCHQHGEQILAQGFSFKKAADATCVEVGGCVSPEDDAINKDTVALSNGLLPPLTALKALSVGGAHTNSFLRAARALCKTPVKQLQDQDGCIDLAALTAKDQNFKDAVEHGLIWTQIDAKVAEMWPSIVDIAQQALNAKAAQEPYARAISSTPLSAATRVCAVTRSMHHSSSR